MARMKNTSTQVRATGVGMVAAVWRSAVDPATAGRWLALADAHAGGSLKLADVLDVDDVLAALQPLLQPVLGDAHDLLVGQCWLRRARPPHAWHQDGALHAAFDGHDVLLPIVTCWLALTDCGRDAPSLEWVEPASTSLLAPPELTDEAVKARHAPAAFAHAELRAGDALLFGGGLLHRTHVTPAMHRPRTSLELRFIDRRIAAPRLTGEPRRPAFPLR